MDKLIHIRATTLVGGSVEFFVERRHGQEEAQRGSLHEFLAHEAWRELFREAKSPTARMLRELCAKLGVREAKAKFTAGLTFEYSEGSF